MADRTIDKRFINVNNKALFNEINDFILDCFKSPGFMLKDTNHRNNIKLIIEEFFTELHQENRIVNFKVVCDTRNNPQQYVKTGRLKIEISFKQWNCINITKLFYDVQLKTFQPLRP